ncbi:hypothetical protein L9F63_015323 [Diploptera punctata]|uniref:Uncharacterized protein n=1 Tax=Diploptera punctata TaxID=6984 RepID=A0AAD8A5T0_DIPPU|nr:hypothetical protein L9F63_015323 [Diploptera punctata]
MEEENATRKLTLLRPDEGRRRRGRPKLRWMDGWNRVGPPKARSPGMDKEDVGQGCMEECHNSSQGS